MVQTIYSSWYSSECVKQVLKLLKVWKLQCWKLFGTPCRTGENAICQFWKNKAPTCLGFDRLIESSATAAAMTGRVHSCSARISGERAPPDVVNWQILAFLQH